MSEDDEILNMNEWYTAPQAIERLEANIVKKLDSAYPRLLARAGLVEAKILSERVRLYRKHDIDGYVVEERGTKAGRAQRQKAVESRRTKKQQGGLDGKTNKGGRQKKQPPDSGSAFVLAL